MKKQDFIYSFEVNNGMTEKELVDKARENGILLTGMSQFFHEGVHKGKPTVILGYSGIDTVNIEKAFKILEQILEILVFLYYNKLIS